MIEKTGACLCCWFLEGESNRKHVITPIFLPCPSVVFPEYLVYLQNWCFLCYRRLPVLVTHHLKKKETFFPVLQMSDLIRKTDIWSGLFRFHSFMPFCLLHFVHPGCGSRADPWWPRLQGHISAQALWHAQTGTAKQSQDLNSSLPAGELSCPDCKCTQ